MVRPSYVLGGRSMQIVYDESGLLEYMKSAVKASPKHPVLIDKYFSDAIEVDADAISDGTNVVVAGIMEHIEEAGVHSGDSACSLPPYSLDQDVIEEIRRQMKALALELGVIGLMNAQFAIKDHAIYVLEVNPRGSRTVPFVSKAIGVPLAKLAMKTMVGKSLPELGLIEAPTPVHLSVKESVFPFNKFPGVDVLLGPEMKSTGEVMGIDQDFGWAFAKSQAGAGAPLPRGGTAFISVKESDRPACLDVVRRLQQLGFTVQATSGTAEYLRSQGVHAESVHKVKEGRPHIVDHIKNGRVALVVNTVSNASSHADSLSIRREALNKGLAYYTTIRGARAAIMGIEAILKKELTIRSLQESPRHRKSGTVIAGSLSRRPWLIIQSCSLEECMPTPITRKGHEALQAELDRLRKVERAKNIEAIAEARAHGDLSENAEYDAAKERQGFIESRIVELQSKLAEARIIETTGRVSDTIVFGATVFLIEQESQSKRVYTLVGQDEADMKVNRISIQSPVGKALIGKRVGDFVEVKTPVKMVEYEVVEIQFEEL